tara:strand:- start:39064 stop:39447 length:384 start_codon:yes stop_codon:yes gene_type:complete
MMSEIKSFGNFNPGLNNQLLVCTYRRIIFSICDEKNTYEYESDHEAYLTSHYTSGFSLYKVFRKYCKTWSMEKHFNPQETHTLYEQMCDDAANCFEDHPEVLELFRANLDALHSLISAPVLMTKAAR